ncbi:hypothetical protein [Patulibacter defluvii]|uniref:hypothetical protein n=1 Tax=Patulibacter defluvii TaxID=3095358 RepID=UPI002A750519|nr:hypothetical protein [Patulibacter sp. DM4]
MSEQRPDGEPPIDDDANLPPLAEHLRVDLDDPRAQNRSRNKLILLLMFGALPMMVVFVVVLTSLTDGPPEPTRGQASRGLGEVTRYCTYVARDDADYRLCLERTDVRLPQRERSNAGRYARGELLRCLSDAGPRCTLR